jgi:hypothetical protein
MRRIILCFSIGQCIDPSDVVFIAGIDSRESAKSLNLLRKVLVGMVEQIE